MTEWKPVELSDGGFTILIDCAEQKPFFVKSVRIDVPIVIDTSLKIPDSIKFERAILKNGDYTIKKYEHIVCIERKQQSDFEGYIGREYARKTISKLRCMRKIKWRGLVIECDETDLYFNSISDYMTKEKVRNQLASMRVHYGMHIYCNASREMCEMWVLDILARIYKYEKEKERYMKSDKHLVEIFRLQGF